MFRYRRPPQTQTSVWFSKGWACRARSHPSAPGLAALAMLLRCPDQRSLRHVPEAPSGVTRVVRSQMVADYPDGPREFGIAQSGGL